MSNNFALRSHGEPYFALVQDNLEGMDADHDIFNGSDVIEGYVTIEVHALPTQLASPEEFHKVWSIHERKIRLGFSVVGTEFAWIAVTPSGRLCAGALNQPVAMTAPGFVVPNGGFRQYRLHYVGASGSLALHEVGPTINGQADLTLLASVTGTPDTAIVTAPRVARQVLFNGQDALTRMPCSIRFARLETGSMSPQWSFNEGQGNHVHFTGAQDPAFPDVTRDFDLTARFLDEIDRPWGDPSGVPIESVYRWELRTEYQRDDPATPEYVRTYQ
jgi:hypothetical protein